MIVLSVKKVILATSIFLILQPVVSAQTRFNLSGGPQLVTVRYVVGDAKQNVTAKPGFQFGFGAKIEFENHLFFSPAIFYSYKGYKVKLDQPADPPDLAAINNNTSIHTLETAFLLQYDFSKRPSHFFIKLGPSLDFQLYGREQYDRSDQIHVSRQMNYGYTSYGRYAASAILHAGYEFKSYILSAYYEYGLSDLNNADDGPSIKYRIGGITFGRYFK
jgi:hypothetical protein